MLERGKKNFRHEGLEIAVLLVLPDPYNFQRWSFGNCNVVCFAGSLSPCVLPKQVVVRNPRHLAAMEPHTQAYSCCLADREDELQYPCHLATTNIFQWRFYFLFLLGSYMLPRCTLPRCTLPRCACRGREGLPYCRITWEERPIPVTVRHWRKALLFGH